MSETILHEANFTILKKDAGYRRKFEDVLKQFQTANLSSHAARYWIADGIYEILLKDVPKSAKDAKWREPMKFKDSTVEL